LFILQSQEKYRVSTSSKTPAAAIKWGRTEGEKELNSDYTAAQMYRYVVFIFVQFPYI
jgi:hypothetical protein